MANIFSKRALPTSLASIRTIPVFSNTPIAPAYSPVSMLYTASGRLMLRGTPMRVVGPITTSKWSSTNGLTCSNRLVFYLAVAGNTLVVFIKTLFLVVRTVAIVVCDRAPNKVIN